MDERKRVLIIAQGCEQLASSRTRILQFLPHIKQAFDYDLFVYMPLREVKRLYSGRSATLIDRLVMKRQRRRLRKFFQKANHYDVVLLQKIVPTADELPLLKSYQGRLVFDFDDAINFKRDGQQSEQSERFAQLMDEVDHVIVENDYNLKQVCPPVPAGTLVTGPIDCDLYQVAPDKYQRDKVFTVGWIGSPASFEFLKPLIPVMEKLLNKYPKQLKWHFVGIDQKPYDHPAVQCFPWSLETETQHLSEFDLGIMPLPDSEYTRGKGGYKLLQYAAAGCALGASPVEINRLIIKNGTGFLAQSPEQWEQAIETYILSPDLCHQAGRLARQWMEEAFSFQAQRQAWIEAVIGQGEG